MFTVEQRDALREHLLRLAGDDERVVAGAAVGSLTVDGGDRFSDLDLTFAIADDVSVRVVLDDWTRGLVDELDAVHLVDLERGPTVYRVFLLPDALRARPTFGLWNAEPLGAALAAAACALIREGQEARLPQASAVAERLAELARPGG